MKDDRYDRTHTEATMTTTKEDRSTFDNFTGAAVASRPSFSVNKDKLEGILASQKSMQNYEDALWSFERTLNREIDSNRSLLITRMEEIFKCHANSGAYQDT